MKRFLVIMLSLALILTLAVGCGGKTEAPAPAQPSAPATSGTPATPSAPATAPAETMGATDVDLSAFTKAYSDNQDKLEGLAGAEVDLIAGNGVSFTSDYTQAMMLMKDLLEDYSNGTMTMTIHIDSTLGGERDLIEGISMGTIDLAVSSTGPAGNFVADCLSLDLPYLFQNGEEAYKVLDSEIGRGILDQFMSQKIYAYNFWENGWRCTSNNKRELVHPEDMSGLKFRTMENKIHMATYTNWGAYPTPMAFGEVYTAMQQGTIDGQENPLSIIYNNKFYEVQPYISMTKVFYSPSVLFVNPDTYNGFTDFQKSCFDKAAAETQAWERNYCNAMLEETKANLAKYSKVTDVNIAEWAASDGVTKTYANAADNGANPTLVDAVFKMLGR